MRAEESRADAPGQPGGRGVPRQARALLDHLCERRRALAAVVVERDDRGEVRVVDEADGRGESYELEQSMHEPREPVEHSPATAAAPAASESGRGQSQAEHRLADAAGLGHGELAGLTHEL